VELAAVHDAVGDAANLVLRLRERVDLLDRLVLADEGELEARRARVDDEDP
jgi:hypothetical protein